MAPRIAEAEGSELVAVCSRAEQTARDFAAEFGCEEVYDSLEAMLASNSVDAVYIATPTGVRETIAVAAAERGKHVLAEKPFASLPSLQRIIAACRDNGVVFMDATHFPHLGRTHHVRSEMERLAGRPCTIDSAFQFDLSDRGDIRYRPELEPYGAIGDAGWYNMRAAVEYLPDDVELVGADAWLRRDDATSAVVGGWGVMRFSEGSVSTWNCGFLSGSVVQDLRITGPEGVLWIDDFVGLRGTERFRWSRDEHAREITLGPGKQAATLMFEDFSKMVLDSGAFEACVRKSERTQAWLDAAWDSALANDG